MNTLIANIYELLGPHQLNVRQEEIDLHQVAPNEIIGKTIVSVVSPGTEVAAYVGAPPLRPMKVYPRVNGYCNVAEVVAVGSDVAGITVGDRVSTHQSHRSAFRCHQSKVNAVLQEEDDAISQATLYLWHLGYYPLLRARAMAGMNVAVIGLGSLGLTTVAAAVFAGCNVLAISNREWACHKAQEFGARSTFGKSSLEAIKAWTNDNTLGVGVDLVISTSNEWEDWRMALEIARDGGSIAVVGFPGRELDTPTYNPLASQYLYDKELTIYACGNPPACDVSPRELRFTLSRNYVFLGEMIRLNRLPARKIVSDTVDWRELDSVYTRLANREPELLTVALEWR